MLYGLRHVKTCLHAYIDSKGPDQPAHLQSDQGLGCLLTESLDTIEYISRANAQVRLHMLGMNLNLFCACWKTPFHLMRPYYVGQ